MFHDAATPTALCSLDTPQAFPRTATDKDAEGLTGCTMHWIMLTTARRRLTHQDAPCGARGAKGRQRRTDGIAAWRRHGGGASVSCLPTTPPCAGLGCELTSFEKMPSMPGRWPADACSPIDACPLCFLCCPRTATPAEPVRAPAPPAPTHTVHRSWTPRPAFSTRDPPPSRPPFPSQSRRPTPARPPFPAPSSPSASHTRLLVALPQMFPTLADFRPHFPGLSVRALWKSCAAVAETVRFRPGARRFRSSAPSDRTLPFP